MAQGNLCCYCNKKVCGKLLCSTKLHTSDGYVDLWTWMHAAYGGGLFIPFSPFFEWTEWPNTFLYWIAIIVVLAIIWEIIECYEKFPELWRTVDGCICNIAFCCKLPSDLEDHKFDKNHNSVSDVLVTCLAYSVSWLVWRSMEGKHDKKFIAIPLVVLPVLCVLMAICQANLCRDFPDDGAEICNYSCSNNGSNDDSAPAKTTTDKCRYTQVNGICL